MPQFEVDFRNENSVGLPLNLMQSSIFPIVLLNGNRMRSIGTCFAISNHGLCLTAKHVIDEVPRKFSSNSDRHAEVDGILGALFISYAHGGSDDAASDLLGGFIPMTKAYTISGIDIAVIHLNLPVHVETGEFIPVPLQRLQLNFPGKDECLFALGYEKGEWERSDDGAHELSQTFTASKGFAREIHPAGRDKVVLPTPCFRTSAAFRSGMSGGPVIGENGLVLGVVSTGFDVVAGEEPISYAAPLAPAMGISIQGIDASGSATTLFLWDFADGGAVRVDQGSAKVLRTEVKLQVEVGGGRYISLLGS